MEKDDVITPELFDDQVLGYEKNTGWKLMIHGSEKEKSCISPPNVILKYCKDCVII